MDRNSCATSFKIVDVLSIIQAKRKRIEGFVARSDFKDHSGWQWMLEWLAKPDDEHLKEELTIKNWTAEDDCVEFDPQQDYIESGYCCNICFKPKRYLLKTSFSFCNEYGCGMSICKECAAKIGELAASVPDEAKEGR
jgi:hypothetical protein